MRSYKRIEFLIGDFISRNYRSAIEVGVGKNMEAARICADRGMHICCTDIKPISPLDGIKTFRDDIFSPTVSIYQGAEVIYSIRPGVEMVPPLISLARIIDADLLVYHMGFEIYESGEERVDCGVILHRYYKRQKPSKSED